MKKKMVLVLVVLCIMGTFVFAATVPGTDGDPLVSLSYIDKRLAELKDELLQKIESIKGSSSTTTPAPASSFTIHEFPVGTKLSFGQNTEFILRVGAAIAMDPANQRLPDLTAGQDIYAGDAIPKNHLVLVPRSDGRGLEVTEKMWIMIKGEFTVVK